MLVAVTRNTHVCLLTTTDGLLAGFTIFSHDFSCHFFLVCAKELNH